MIQSKIYPASWVQELFAHLCKTENREKLLTLAEKYLKQDLLTVTRKRNSNPLPEGADLHDFVSIAPYWWPDPEKPDGLPWIRRDGEVNPVFYEYDSSMIFDLIRHTGIMLLCGFVTGEERFFRRTAEQLKCWFLDPATKMKPHLNYAQFVPGRCTGRCYGIIDFHTMIYVLDLIPQMPFSDFWTENDLAGLREWYSTYLQWLETAPLAVEECRTLNNHATAYDIQYMGIALFLNRPELIEKQIKVTRQRMETQFAGDGTLPLEMARTQSQSYSTGGLFNFFLIHVLGANVHADLLSAKTAKGITLEKALHKWENMMAGEWPVPQLAPMDKSEQGMLCFLTGKLLNRPDLVQRAYECSAKRPWSLLYGFQGA